MSRMSVRARLTALVVLVAIVLGGLAATVGVSAVEQSLVDEAVVANGDNQMKIVDEVLSFSGSVVEILGIDPLDAEGVEFAEEFAITEAIESVRFSLLELRSSGRLDELLADIGGPETEMVILTNFGQLVVFDPVASTLTLVDADQVDTDTVVAQFVLEELTVVDLDADLEEIFVLDDGELVFEAGDLDDAGDEDVVIEFARQARGDVEFVTFADVGDVERSVDSIRQLVWLVLPVLVVLGGGLAWLLTGRALRPVHAITSRVGAISSGTLHERVPEPETGDEIAELAATMNAMLDRLEVDDKRLRQFVSDASHELRSPVAVLRSEAEVAKRAPESTSVTELADGVLGESTRLQRIVEDLLVLARGEERHGAQRIEIDVDDIVLAEAARRRRIPVDTHAVSAGRVWGSADAIARVVTHLLDNAARHGGEMVAVGLHTAGGQVVLWVDDDGPGIAQSDRSRVFERFTRLDDARTRDRGGAGLGLAVVAETVRGMGGSVDVDDAPAGGARFTVRWPAANHTV